MQKHKSAILLVDSVNSAAFRIAQASALSCSKINNGLQIVSFRDYLKTFVKNKLQVNFQLYKMNSISQTLRNAISFEIDFSEFANSPTSETPGLRLLVLPSQNNVFH